MVFIYQVVNSMEQRPEKLTLLLAGQELSYVVLNPRVHCCVEFCILCMWCAIFDDKKCQVQEGLFPL